MTKEAFLSNAHGELAVDLARGNQAEFDVGLNVYATLSGSSTLPGAEAPFQEEKYLVALSFVFPTCWPLDCCHFLHPWSRAQTLL